MVTASGTVVATSVAIAVLIVVAIVVAIAVGIAVAIAVATAVRPVLIASVLISALIRSAIIVANHNHIGTAVIALGVPLRAGKVNRKYMQQTKAAEERGCRSSRARARCHRLTKL